jgi:hypothetical protein
MAGIERNSFDSPDETRPLGGIALFSLALITGIPQGGSA